MLFFSRLLQQITDCSYVSFSGCFHKNKIPCIFWWSNNLGSWSVTWRLYGDSSRYKISIEILIFRDQFFFVRRELIVFSKIYPTHDSILRPYQLKKNKIYYDLIKPVCSCYPFGFYQFDMKRCSYLYDLIISNFSIYKYVVKKRYEFMWYKRTNIYN